MRMPQQHVARVPWAARRTVRSARESALPPAGPGEGRDARRQRMKWEPSRSPTFSPATGDAFAVPFTALVDMA
jgi:hypothetical protein